MFVFLLAAVVLPTAIFGHQIIPCGGGLPAPTALNVANCPTSPCNVNQGESVAYTVSFVPSAASNDMTLNIVSTVFGESNPVPLPEPLSNACNNMQPPCPVTAGQTVTQGASLPVATEHHGGVPAELRVSMISNNITHMCCLLHLIIH